jgi:hypothetical protein
MTNGCQSKRGNLLEDGEEEANRNLSETTLSMQYEVLLSTYIPSVCISLSIEYF